jgi:hypothetical protein
MRAWQKTKYTKASFNPYGAIRTYYKTQAGEESRGKDQKGKIGHHVERLSLQEPLNGFPQ